MKFIKQAFLLLLFPFLILSSCKKDELLTDSSAKLDFSTDSILFDTVFTSIGSTTKLFKVYNSHNQPMNISRIRLATGTNSQFRINVDGISAVSHNDVEILGDDSLYVFVQVTVNPLNINSPMLIKDSIIFETNGNIQDVKLTAIGQDVYLHKPDHFSTTGFPAYSIINCNDVWTNDKPHLIFGYAVVDSACTLTMLQGTRVHIHNGGVLWIYKDGTLIINGMHGNEVTIQGDRLEPEFKDIPGQWGKIWMMKGSKNNSIDWAIIKNGSIGIQVDSINISGIPSLKLNNTIIKNMQAAALYGQGAHIWSSNCLFANCGQYVAALALGGKYKFEHCTFGNFWTYSTRSTPLLLMNNYYVDINSVIQVRSLDSCYFGNCILYGDQGEEIGIDSTSSGLFKYKFENTLIKTTRSLDINHYFSCWANSSPGFSNIGNNNYEISASSAAKDVGYPTLIIKDLNFVGRPNPDTSIPDLGAYEFYP